MEIHRAVDHGDLDEVQKRLEKGEPINTIELDNIEGGLTPLMIAATSPLADERMIRLLVEHGANVNSVSQGIGRTPLVLAAHTGTEAKVRALLEAGAPADFTGKHGCDALILAALNPGPDRHAIIERLIEAGSPLDGRTSHSETAIGYTGLWGDFQLIARLLDRGADPSPLKWTPMMHAVALGDQEAVARVARPDDADVCDHFERTAWVLSIMRGDIGIAETLEKAGAASGRLGGQGQTPLMYACDQGRHAMVRWLIERGADVNEVDEYQRTPLHFAASARAGAAPCVRILLEAGADPVAEDHVEDQPIHETSDLEVIDLLMAAGADPNKVSGQGYTLLRHAAEQRNHGLIAALLERGIPDRPGSEYSATALDTAVMMDDPVIVDMLIKAGSAVNREWDDDYPIHRVRSLAVARLLLKAGADPRQPIFPTGELPEAKARRERKPELAELLRRYSRWRG